MCYKNFRANGGSVGRKQGYRKSDETMKAEYAEEIRLLKKGYSLRNVAKLTNTSINTLRKLSINFVKKYSSATSKVASILVKYTQNTN